MSSSGRVTARERQDRPSVAVQAVAPGVYRIELSYRPVSSVNVFVLKDDAGLTLVDSGPLPDEYLEAVGRGLEMAGLGGLDSVHTVLLTHAHTDHIGQAARIQGRSGARCVLDPQGVAFAAQRFGEEADKVQMDWFRSHGLPDGMEDRVRGSLPRVPPIPRFEAYGPTIDAGGFEWSVLPSGGHAPGHVVLHSAARGIVFVGDAVLEKIVPLIDVQPFRPQGIVGQYLQELRELRGLGEVLVLPGHGESFRGLSERVDGLIERHEERLRRIVERCQTEPMSAYSLSAEVFDAGRLPVVRMRMAFGQTIGYLRHLEERGLIESVGAGPAIVWRAKSAVSSRHGSERTVSGSTVGGTGLEALFAPQSIAIIGASGEENRIGGRPLKYLVQAGYRGRIYPVNPRYETLQGLPCFPDVASLPESVDLAVIALGADRVLQTVRELVALGVRAAVVFASEFAEHDDEGRRRQEELTAIAREGGIRILGPNTVGMRDLESAVFGTFSTDVDSGVRTGPLAIVTQSGGLGVYFGSVLPRLASFGARFMVDTGNEADIDSAECIEYLSREAGIRAIGVVLEGASDGRRFIEACVTAARRGKHVVVLKIGRTPDGAIAAASHSGALAGEDAVWDAALRAAGAVRAHDEVEFFDLLNVFGVARPPVGRRLGIVSLSGGVATMMIDSCADFGLEIPPYAAPPREVLQGIPEGSKGNPLDVSANLANNPEITGSILEHVLAQDSVDALVLWMAYLPMSPILGPPIAAQIRAVAECATKPIYLVGLASEGFAADVVGAGVPIFTYPSRLLRALSRAADAGEPSMPAMPSASGGIAVGERGASTVSLTGPNAERYLSGLPFARSIEVTDPQAAALAAQEIGFPVVMKGEALGLLHKTELSLVEVGIADADAAAATYGRLRSRLDGEGLDGIVVVQDLVSGLECFVGARRDPVFGPTVTFGLGGTLVEHDSDVTTLLAPTDRTRVLAAVKRLRGAPRFRGLRGDAPKDTSALADIVVELSRRIASDANLVEVDLNPVIVGEAGAGAVAVDAVVIRH